MYRRAFLPVAAFAALAACNGRLAEQRQAGEQLAASILAGYPTKLLCEEAQARHVMQNGYAIDFGKPECYRDPQVNNAQTAAFDVTVITPTGHRLAFTGTSVLDQGLFKPAGPKP